MQLRLAVSHTNLVRLAPRRSLQRTPQRAAASRVIQANTLWQLQPGEPALGAAAAAAAPHKRRALPEASAHPWLLHSPVSPRRRELVQAEPAVVQGAVPGAPAGAAAGMVTFEGLALHRLAPFQHSLPLQVDLTGNIGRKRVCSIASGDFQSSEAIDLCVLDHG